MLDARDNKASVNLMLSPAALNAKAHLNPNSIQRTYPLSIAMASRKASDDGKEDLSARTSSILYISWTFSANRNTNGRTCAVYDILYCINKLQTGHDDREGDLLLSRRGPTSKLFNSPAKSRNATGECTCREVPPRRHSLKSCGKLAVHKMDRHGDHTRRLFRRSADEPFPVPFPAEDRT